MEKVKRVAAAVIERNGRVLLGKRPASKRYGGLWEFPGGKVEPNETIAAAVRREIQEELGVDVVSVGEVVFSVDDPGSRFVIEFCWTTIVGMPVAIEHDHLEWVEYEDLCEFELAPGDHEFSAWLLNARDFSRRTRNRDSF